MAKRLLCPFNWLNSFTTNLPARARHSSAIPPKRSAVTPLTQISVFVANGLPAAHNHLTIYIIGYMYLGDDIYFHLREEFIDMSRCFLDMTFSKREDPSDEVNIHFVIGQIGIIFGDDVTLHLRKLALAISHTRSSTAHNHNVEQGLLWSASVQSSALSKYIEVYSAGWWASSTPSWAGLLCEYFSLPRSWW